MIRLQGRLRVSRLCSFLHFRVLLASTDPHIKCSALLFHPTRPFPGVRIEKAYLEFVNLQRMVGQGQRVFRLLQDLPDGAPSPLRGACLHCG